MTAGEERDEKLLDDFALSYDSLGDFVGDAAVGFAEALDGLEVFGHRFQVSGVRCQGEDVGAARAMSLFWLAMMRRPLPAARLAPASLMFFRDMGGRVRWPVTAWRT
jgi:hypothetical protein